MTDVMSPPVPMPPFEYVPRPYNGPTREQVLALRRQYVNPAVFTLYRDPLMIVDGKMQYVFDETGRRYLDLFAGIVTVSCGHCHPKVVQRVQEQAATLQHTTTIYLHPNLSLLAQKLASKMPEGLEVTYFVNSGSEANDLAVTLARLYTGNLDVVAVRNAYHGGSPSSVGLTSHHTWKYPLPGPTAVHHALSPDPSGSSGPGSPEEIASRAANDIRELIRYSTPGSIAAFIAEPIQGVGGVTRGAPNYFREAYAITREYGGLCIADEVQTGFGRTGRLFAMEHYGVLPDILVSAKSLAAGLPLSAVTGRAEIMDASHAGGLGGTYGGNPIACAAALAAIDVFENDGMLERAREIETLLKGRLQQLQAADPRVGDVRGHGAMIAAEFVDPATGEPDAALTAAVAKASIAQGVIVLTCGTYGNVIRFLPPLSITDDLLHEGLDVVAAALAAS
jgi:4-aminobutyrate aminotransferase